MSRKVFVAGVGMIPFVKPGQNKPYHEMGAQAARLALIDADLTYGKVQQTHAGYELTHQLRGTAEARQVDGARNALQHNLGLGGACVVTLYQRA